MSSRSEILNAIRKNKPAESALPLIPVFDSPQQDVETLFEQTLNKIGGTFTKLRAAGELPALLQPIFAEKQMIVSNVAEYKGTHDLKQFTNALQLEKLDVAVLQGEIAVAENASIWLNGDTLPFRAVPLICEHLVLVFNRKSLVNNMHEAYKKIAVNSSSYGTFIAGPSKTADIEQSLVIGAHGPRSMMAVILD